MLIIVKEMGLLSAKICENARFWLDTDGAATYRAQPCRKGTFASLVHQDLWDEAVQFVTACNASQPVWLGSGSLGFVGNLSINQWMLVPPPAPPKTMDAACPWPVVKPINRNGYLAINEDINLKLPMLCVKTQ